MLPGRRVVMRGTGRWTVACVIGALAVALTGGGAAARQPSVPQVALAPDEVPGFSVIDRSVQTYQDPSDAGVDQAFIGCAGSTALLSEYDEGGDNTISQVYGQGDNGFGAPALSVASVVFGSSDPGLLDAAYAKLSGATFQTCWLSTIDRLNAQSSAPPLRPSTLTPLGLPHLGSAATGFLMHWDVSVLGRALLGQFGVSIVRTGSYVVMLYTLGWGTGFPDATRLAILQRFVGRIGGSATTSSPPPISTAPAPSQSSGAPAPTGPPSVALYPVDCTPNTPPSGDASSGAALAGGSVNAQDHNSYSGDAAMQSALQQVYAHRTDPEYLVGFFNAINTSRLIDWLRLDRNGQPLEPDGGYDPVAGTIVFGENGDWFFKEIEIAAATCQLTRNAAFDFLNQLNDTQPRLELFSQNPDAARGLLVPLSWQDILQVVDSKFEVPGYSALAGAALSAGEEISALAPPPWQPAPTARFRLDQANALELKAQFTSDGQQDLEDALTRYAQHTEPPAPAPQRLGALAAATGYTTWATEIGDLGWAISVRYAAETAAGWKHPSVEAWNEALGKQNDAPGANPDLTAGGDAPAKADFTALQESNVDGATDYALLLTQLVVRWLQYQAHAAQIQQYDQATAAQWLCSRQPRIEAMLFDSMLHSQRLLYTLNDSRTPPAPLVDGVVIDGAKRNFDDGTFPPLSQDPTTYANVAGILRPPAAATWGALLADATGGTTGLSARVPFDSVVWSWEQKVSQDGVACTTLPSVPVVAPTSGIGSALVVTGSGYAPGSSVTITGHSATTLLGTAVADNRGRFAAFLGPAQHLAPGDHEIIATGRTPTGSPHEQRWTITIVRRPATVSAYATASGTDAALWPALGAGFVLLLTAVTLLRQRHRRSNKTQSPAPPGA
jgi:hypothetical protein